MIYYNIYTQYYQTLTDELFIKIIFYNNYSVDISIFI